MYTKKIDAAVAYDGKEFYGDNCYELCEEYEVEQVKNIENKMLGNVYIYNRAYFFNFIESAYIKFVTDDGKDLFLEWCRAQNITIVNRLELHNLYNDKWYRINYFHETGSYSVNTIDIVRQIDILKVQYDKLMNVDEDKVFSGIMEEG